MAKNLKNRRAVKKLPCLVCGTMPTDCAHVSNWKITQCDEIFNLIPLCRRHHREQHSRGFDRFLKEYPNVKEVLKIMGWRFMSKVGGGIYLQHDGLIMSKSHGAE